MKAPNTGAGNRARGTMPTSGAPSPATVPNAARGDHRRGSVSIQPMPSPVRAPDHRFSTSNAKMPQPPSAVETGHGAIPVIPGEGPSAALGKARVDTALALKPTGRR